ncbi:hypothetical protein F5Y17DRAFT_461654 [Xylariaceae sp. FL0594]|nr:hypothetical protein F5Y17DRAFT_461654 [Xylariaceae sp. FL0594]
MSGTGRSRSSYRQPIDLDSHASDLPLLEKEDKEGKERDRGRAPTRRLDSHSGSGSIARAVSTTSAAVPPPILPRRSHSHSAGMIMSVPKSNPATAARKKYVLAGTFLAVCLFAFVVQTELGRYVQHELGWDKAYCMLYLTHGSWTLLWPSQLLFLRLRLLLNNNPSSSSSSSSSPLPWSVFWRRHVDEVWSTAQLVASTGQGGKRRRKGRRVRVVPYMLRTTALVTTTLTLAGLTWYVAVNMTSPGDLTAIYNCSAFFAYAFSVPLLKEKLRLDKCLAVLVAIIGVLVVAYGDTTTTPSSSSPTSRFTGNCIIGLGSVLYGLYEVLYKSLACPPAHPSISPARGVIFANTFGSLVGLFTLLVLWLPLPVLHYLGWETFELPTGKTAFYLGVSVLMNALFAGSFLVLISLTSPVLSSVAALLTIFIVALADWAIAGETPGPAALAGGLLIVAAFGVLAWSTWREMREDEEDGYREVGGDEEEGEGEGEMDRRWEGEWDGDGDEDGESVR